MSYFPFGSVGSNSQPPVPYDIVASKTYPRIAFVPQEQNGVYQELVEVNGDLWIVSNAYWDTTLQGFYQENSTLVNCNPAQSAYATVLRGISGDSVRMYAAPAGNTTTPLTWVPVFDTNPTGTTVSPNAITLPGYPAFAVNATFAGTTNSLLNAFQVNITSSGGASLLSPAEQINVNGTPVWQVDLTGTLRVGFISAATITPAPYLQLLAGTGIGPITAPPNATIGLAHGDYVDLANAQTITGTKTISPLTPVVFGGAWGNIVGGNGNDYYLVSGADITNLSPLTAIAKNDKAIIIGFQVPTTGQPPPAGSYQVMTIFVDRGLSRSNTYSPTPVAFMDANGNLTLLTGGIIAGGNSSVTGNFSITGNLVVGNKATFNGNIVLGSKNTLLSLGDYFESNVYQNDFPTGGGSSIPNLQNISNGAGLVIGYDPATSTIAFDTSALALIGATGKTGLISSDGSISITKKQGSTQVVDFSAQLGTVAFAVGSNPTLDKSGNVSASLQVGPLPAGKYFCEAQVGGFSLLASGGTGSTAALTMQGSSMTTNATEYIRYLYVFATVSSSGSASPSASFTVSNGRSTSDTISFSLKAIRIG